MPILHTSNEHYYNGIINFEQNKKGSIYKWNPIRKVYEYSNTLYPNKNYTKIFDPKSIHINRGDVIHFGNDDYRNNGKMIFDGEKFEHLYTNVDDYGSVPPNYVVGDNEDEFNIGDFEEIIDHNTINWLSKDKLKEIKLYEETDEIFGKVIIKSKEWKIYFEIDQDTEFNTAYSRNYSRKYNCQLENNNIIIKKLTNKVSDAKYLITSSEEKEKNKLLSLIQNDNEVNIISYYCKASKGSPYPMVSKWFLFQIINEYKFMPINENIPNFPIIWNKKGSSYDCQTIILDEESYKKYIKYDEKELDKVYINNIIRYSIEIESIKEDNNIIMDNIQKYINKLIENYDDINKRHPINRECKNLLCMYM